MKITQEKQNMSPNDSCVVVQVSVRCLTSNLRVRRWKYPPFVAAHDERGLQLCSNVNRTFSCLFYTFNLLIPPLHAQRKPKEPWYDTTQKDQAFLSMRPEKRTIIDLFLHLAKSIASPLVLKPYKLYNASCLVEAARWSFSHRISNAWLSHVIP